jgi:hypothetical protein
MYILCMWCFKWLKLQLVTMWSIKPMIIHIAHYTQVVMQHHTVSKFCVKIVAVPLEHDVTCCLTFQWIKAVLLFCPSALWWGSFFMNCDDYFISVYWQRTEWMGNHWSIQWVKYLLCCKILWEIITSRKCIKRALCKYMIWETFRTKLRWFLWFGTHAHTHTYHNCNNDIHSQSLTM